MFSGKIPYEISHFSSLVSLDLSYYYVLLIETPVWKNLTQLRELLLDWSDMSSIRPNYLMNLSSSFTTLSLHNCNLQGELESNILYFPSIQTLDLGVNDYFGSSLLRCNWSNSLKFLDPSLTNLSGELLNFIDNLKSLMHLDFYYCNLTGSIPTALAYKTYYSGSII